MKRYKVRKTIWRFLRHIQFINEVSDLLHILLGCNSGLQNLIKNVLSIHYTGIKQLGTIHFR